MSATFDPVGLISLAAGAAILASATGAFTFSRWFAMFLGLGIAQIQATYKAGPKWLRGRNEASGVITKETP